VWIAAKSRETLSCLEHHPLKSSAIKSQIMQVQRVFNEIKDYEDEIAGKTRETISGEFEDLDDLKDKFTRLKEIMIKNIENLGLELEARKGFEFEVDQVTDWIKRAEAAVYSDTAPSETRVASLQEHLDKFQTLVEESATTQEKLQELREQFMEDYSERLQSADRVGLESKFNLNLQQITDLREAAVSRIGGLESKVQMIREKESSAKSLADAVAVAQDQLMESSGQAEALEEVATTLAKLKKDTAVQGAVPSCKKWRICRHRQWPKSARPRERKASKMSTRSSLINWKGQFQPALN